MALTSAWNWRPSSRRIEAGLVAITEASPQALVEPANARPRPLALFSFSWKAAASAWLNASAPAMPTARAVMRAIEEVCMVDTLSGNNEKSLVRLHWGHHL